MLFDVIQISNGATVSSRVTLASAMAEVVASDHNVNASLPESLHIQRYKIVPTQSRVNLEHVIGYMDFRAHLRENGISIYDWKK